MAYSPEFAPAGADRGRATLAALSRATGGRSRASVEKVWDDLPRRPRLIELSPWLLLAAVLVFLLEVFERRSGLLSIGRRRELKQRRAQVAALDAADDAKAATQKTVKPVRAKKKATQAAATAVDGSAKPQAAGEKQVAGKHQSDSPEAQPSGSVFDAMKKAQQRASGRTRRR